MSKSFPNNKVFIFLVLFLILAPSAILAQINMYGNWSIDKILGLNDFTKYSIVRQDEKNPSGNMLTLNLDGTFLCKNLPECGNDIFHKTSGNFILLDDLHIRFILINKSRNNKEGDLESNLSKDLGIFYIYKEGNSIRLIPSNGILQDDKEKMLYAELAYSYGKEWRSYNYVWKNTDKTEPEEIIKECIEGEKSIKWSNCKILLPSLQGSLFIVKENEKLHYIYITIHLRKRFL